MKLATIEKIREKSPLILFLTNSVTENLCANVLLSIGGSPIMSHAHQELGELIPLVAGLVINIGTLDDAFIQRAQQAIDIANRLQRPIVFDPVGAGASRYRTQTAQSLISQTENVTLRANASELLALAGTATTIKGVDSIHSTDHALDLAQRYIETPSIRHIVLTGKTDYVLDEHDIKSNSHGHALMTKVSGMGCALNGCLAASLCVTHHSIDALTDTLEFYTQTAERCGALTNHPGSFVHYFIDGLSQ